MLPNYLIPVIENLDLCGHPKNSIVQAAEKTPLLMTGRSPHGGVRVIKTSRPALNQINNSPCVSPESVNLP